MRYLGKCTKESEIKFISHLDFLRTIQRMIRRAGLPAAYSHGYNPHLNLSIAQPLGVGAFSSSEYFDFNLLEDLDEKYIKDMLSKSAPRGIKIIDIVKVDESKLEKKVPQSMALISAARYNIKIPYLKTEEIKNDMDSLIKNHNWDIVRKTKKTEKEVNIRTMIKKMKYKIQDEYLEFDILMCCGSKENLSPQLFCEFIQNNTKNCDLNRFIYVQRKEFYTYHNKKLLSLQDYFKRLNNPN